MLELCSRPIHREAEGFGQKRRICNDCSEQQVRTVVTDVKHSFFMNRKPKIPMKCCIVKQTSIMDGPDTMTDVRRYCEVKTAVEGWRGFSLPPKKSYNWRTNSVFPNLIATSKKSIIGDLKNGKDPSLRVPTIKNQPVMLSICSFVLACQLFVTAYCDSINYRYAVDHCHARGTLLEVAKYMAPICVNAVACSKRRSVLVANIPYDNLRGGVLTVDCATDCSSLLRRMNLLPYITETYCCSSPHCPKQWTKRNVTTVATNFKEDLKKCFTQLETFDQGRCDGCCSLSSTYD